MTKAEREELRRLDREATPAPWDTKKGPEDNPLLRVDVYTAGSDRRATANAILAVEARNALPSLLDDLEAAEARVAELAPLPATHGDLVECVTWYDGCHCTVETLEHNIKRAEAAEARVGQLTETADVLSRHVLDLQMSEDSLKARIKELEQWVSDLQSGMYINCVYCGHRYGPDPGTPVAMADVLKVHVEQCPKHPLSHASSRTSLLEGLLREVLIWMDNWKGHSPLSARIRTALGDGHDDSEGR